MKNKTESDQSLVTSPPSGRQGMSNAEELALVDRLSAEVAEMQAKLRSMAIDRGGAL